MRSIRALVIPSPHHTDSPGNGGAETFRGERRRAATRRRSAPRSTTSGGRKRSVRGPVALTTSRCSSSARRASSGASASTSIAAISPRARTSATRGSSRRPSREPLAELADAGEQRLVVEHVERRVGRRAGQRAAREGRAVVAGSEDVRQPRADHQRADREPAAEPLGQGHRVRHHARRLVRPQRAGAAHAGLHLVEHQRRAHLVARLARRPQHLVGHRVHAATRRAPAPSAPPPCCASTAARTASTARARSAGSPAPAARTAPAWTPAAWPTARRRCGRGRRRGRPRCRRAAAPCARASTPPRWPPRPSCRRTPTTRRTASTSRSASRTIGALKYRFETCISRPACSWIAATTCGWQWPVLQTATPERKSRYSTPSESTSTQPEPDANSTGKRA